MLSGAKRKVILLIDMDCFYVQVERRKNPELCDKPCIVVQGTGFGEGATIAVSYEARKFGVSRSTRTREATLKCPDIKLAYVPERRGKADLTCYRQAGAEVLRVLAEYTDVIERASIDEAFLDVTELVSNRIKAFGSDHVITADCVPNTHIPGCKGSEVKGFESWLSSEGCDEQLPLTVGAMIANDIRQEVLSRTGFTCSAGIGYNKMVAKLCAGMNKPNGQTILPPSVLPEVFMTTPIGKIRYLGGKLGSQLKAVYGIEHIGELTSVPLTALEDTFGSKTGSWLYGLCRGEDSEPVRVRTLPQSIGCGKQFPGKNKLTTGKDVKHWLQQLAEEVTERVETDQRENGRRASLLSVHFHTAEKRSGYSRCFPMDTLEPDYIVKKAWAAINKGQTSVGNDEAHLTWTSGLTGLYLVASKFTETADKTASHTLDNFLLKDGQVPENKSTADHSISKESLGTKSSIKTTRTLKQYFSPVKQASNRSSEQSTSSPPAKKQRLESLDSASLTTSTAPPHHPIQHIQAASHNSSASERFTLSDSKIQTAPESSERLPISTLNEHSFTEDTVLSCPDESWDSLPPDLVTICSVCGRQIPVWEEQEHIDYHVALQLQESDQRGPLKGESSGKSPGSKGRGSKTKRNASILDHFVVK